MIRAAERKTLSDRLERLIRGCHSAGRQNAVPLRGRREMIDESIDSNSGSVSDESIGAPAGTQVSSELREPGAAIAVAEGEPLSAVQAGSGLQDLPMGRV